MEKQWQPIETAPSGKEVLVATSGQEMFVAELDSRRNWEVWDGENWHKIQTEVPTHWMELPSFPD